MGSSMSMASRVATGSRAGCISAKSDKCLKARTVSGESRNREILMIAIHSTKRQRGLIWSAAARAIIGIFLAAALACCTATPAPAAEALYRAQTVVTGQGEANRMIGFASCMEDVLIKVSGAERLAGDRRLAAYKAKAKDFVTAFDYRDQFSGKPKRDEQGTRDRPFDLTVDFDKEKSSAVHQDSFSALAGIGPSRAKTRRRASLSHGKLARAFYCNESKKPSFRSLRQDRKSTRLNSSHV